MAMTRAIAIALLCVLSACGKDGWDDCVTSTGPMRAEERDVPAFHAVDLSDRVDLVLERRPTGSLVVEAGRNLLGQVSTEVVDGVLRVRNDNRCNWVRSFKPRITVRVPVADVGELVLRGTGHVTSDDTVRRGAFRIQQQNAQGSVTLTVDVDVCEVGLHTGAGDVTLLGRSGTVHLYSGIQGPIDASGMRAAVVHVNNSGVADIRCQATGSLYAGIHGVGDVLYSGRPDSVRSEITGRGRLIKAE